MEKQIAIISGNEATISWRYHLSDPMQYTIFLEKGETAPHINGINHIWFLSQQDQKTDDESTEDASDEDTDEELDEELDETFPASDPITKY